MEVLGFQCCLRVLKASDFLFPWKQGSTWQRVVMQWQSLPSSLISCKWCWLISETSLNANWHVCNQTDRVDIIVNYKWKPILHKFWWNSGLLFFIKKSLFSKKKKHRLIYEVFYATLFLSALWLCYWVNNKPQMILWFENFSCVGVKTRFLVWMLSQTNSRSYATLLPSNTLCARWYHWIGTSWWWWRCVCLCVHM